MEDLGDFDNSKNKAVETNRSWGLTMVQIEIYALSRQTFIFHLVLKTETLIESNWQLPILPWRQLRPAGTHWDVGHSVDGPIQTLFL